MIRRVTKRDNEWYNEWQRMTQTVTTSDNERQRVVISTNVLFFEINLLIGTLKAPFKPWERLWRGPIELRADLAKQAL